MKFVIAYKSNYIRNKYELANRQNRRRRIKYTKNTWQASNLLCFFIPVPWIIYICIIIRFASKFYYTLNKNLYLIFQCLRIVFQYILRKSRRNNPCCVFRKNLFNIHSHLIVTKVIFCICPQDIKI